MVLVAEKTKIPVFSRYFSGWGWIVFLPLFRRAWLFSTVSFFRFSFCSPWPDRFFTGFIRRSGPRTHLCQMYRFQYGFIPVFIRFFHCVDLVISGPLGRASARTGFLPVFRLLLGGVGRPVFYRFFHVLGGPPPGKKPIKNR